MITESLTTWLTTKPLKDIADVTCVAHTSSVTAGYSDISEESLFRSATAEHDSRKSSVQGE